MTDYLREPHRREIVEWLLSKGFVEDRGMLGIAWSTRIGIDYTDLLFYPLARRLEDPAWDAVIGHHASGTNPRMNIGTCETLADVRMVYDTIRRINGYLAPNDEDRGSVTYEQFIAQKVPA
jgi:hypothetical protein